MTIRILQAMLSRCFLIDALVMDCYEGKVAINSKNVILILMQSATINELKKVIALSDLPDEHLQWIFDHSFYTEYEDGGVIMKTGEVAEYMMFIVEGGISFYMDKGGTLVHFFDFGNDVATGGVTGLLPYSRMKTSPGTSFADRKVAWFPHA